MLPNNHGKFKVQLQLPEFSATALQTVEFWDLKSICLDIAKVEKRCLVDSLPSTIAKDSYGLCSAKLKKTN